MLPNRQCGGLLAASKSIRPVCCDDKYYHYICQKQGSIKDNIKQLNKKITFKLLKLLLCIIILIQYLAQLP